jgi:DNA-binding NtrC family response regulator
MASILVVEDERILAKNICDALRLNGYDTLHAPSGEDGLDKAADQSFDLILLDLRLPGIDGMEVLRTLRKKGDSTPIVIMTAHGSIETAVLAMREGAQDFLTKPLDLKTLQIVAERVLGYERAKVELDYFRDRERTGSGIDAIIGESAQTRAAKAMIMKLAKSPAISANQPPSVLITGETGTGKDLFARAVHFEGPRSEGQFVHVNCTALPDELFEAELFGHVKGAFTSAVGTKKGLMEVADGGTIFFDEIGHMKPALQAKLLTSLEHRKIRPVGGTSEKTVNVHVVAATNRDLQAAIEAGEFRDDLYHRLRVIPIELAPLRERVEDIQPLAEHFVGVYSSRFGTAVNGISPEGFDVLKKYDWPGNVRELSHVLENAILMTDDRFIGPQHLMVSSRECDTDMQLQLDGDVSLSVDFESGKPILEDIEYATMQAALKFAGQNVSRAARVLGITREALRYRINKYEQQHGKPDSD